MPCYALLLAWQVWRLLLTPHGVPSTWGAADGPAVSIGGRGVSQVFQMGADGLDGLWVRVRPQPPGASAPRGDLLVSLGRLEAGGPVPLDRVVIPAPSIRPGARHLPFREVRQARGQRFVVTLRHVGHGDSPPLLLDTRPDDAYPAGRFDANGVERWGDLVFEATATRATLPYWKDEILAPWPVWLGQWHVIAALWLGFNLLLARACAAAVSPAPAVRDQAVAVGIAPAAGTEAGGAGSAAARAALLATVLLVAGSLAIAAWPVPPLRSLQLDQHLAAADIVTPAPSLHDAIAVQPVAFAGRAYRSIVALPPSTLSWTVDLPTGALLEGYAAMRPDVWDAPSDGVNLRVTVVDAAGRRHTVAAFTLVPAQIWEHRGLHPFRVSLDPWARTRVTLVFETDPERWGNAVNDVPIWVEPRIVWPRGRAWGEGRIGTEEGRTGGREDWRTGGREERGRQAASRYTYSANRRWAWPNTVQPTTRLVPARAVSRAKVAPDGTSWWTAMSW